MTWSGPPSLVAQQVLISRTPAASTPAHFNFLETIDCLTRWKRIDLCREPTIATA
jgi:hypothetical protein